MPEDLGKVLAELKPSDVAIDRTGRIVIKNPELAKRVQELGADAPMDSPNGSDCNHNCAPEEIM